MTGVQTCALPISDVLFKINKEFKKAYKDNSNDLNLALFGREWIFEGKCFALPPAYLPSSEFKADKIELDSDRKSVV